jgi:hypothetical protein
MNQFQGRWLVLAVLGILTVSAASPGEVGDDFKPEAGYTALFNGKDLSGWRLGKEALDGKKETGNKKWHVTDGAIVTEGGGGGDIYTVKDFDKDYNLKLEFRASVKADSGVYIRGVQLQVRDFMRRGEQKQLTKYKNDDWNELDITVKGPVYTTTVNNKALNEKDTLEVTVKDGKPTARINGQPADFSSISVSVGAIAECKCNGELMIEKAMKVGLKGGVGLQSETGKFEFRRVRIKELP